MFPPSCFSKSSLFPCYFPFFPCYFPLWESNQFQCYLFLRPPFSFCLSKKKKRRGRCKKKNRLPFCRSVLLSPARTTGYGHHLYRARYFAFARRAEPYLLYRRSACLFEGAGPSLHRALRPGGASKRGPQPPYVGRFQGGVPRGEIEIPPLVCLWVLSAQAESTVSQYLNHRLTTGLQAVN